MTRDAKLTREGVEDALVYLAESAKEYAEAKGRRVWLEGRLQVVKAGQFAVARSTGKSAADSEGEARGSAAYQECLDELRDAVTAEETMRAYRVAAEARIEVFRTLESSRRAANV